MNFKELTGYDETKERKEAYDQGWSDGAKTDGIETVDNCPYGVDSTFEWACRACYKAGFWNAMHQRINDTKECLEALRYMESKREKR